MVMVAPGGSKKLSVGNTSNALLGAGEVFTGAWELNDFDQVLVNLVSDQAGTLNLDFGIVYEDADGAPQVYQTFSSPTQIYADTPLFRTTVKGRHAFRVRYTNGSTPQGVFHLHCSYGDSLFPVSATDDNETLVTVTEREQDNFAAIQAADVSADQYQILIDLSDTTNFPHDRNGRVDLTNTFLP